MAMDILSIPITTVASESTFSAGGRVIDKKRASMRRDTIEVLLCAGDWIKEAYGIRSVKDGNDDPIECEYENEYEMKDPNSTDSSKSVPEVAIKDKVVQESIKSSNTAQPSREVRKPKQPAKKVQRQSRAGTGKSRKT